MASLDDTQPIPKQQLVLLRRLLGGDVAAAVALYEIPGHAPGTRDSRALERLLRDHGYTKAAEVVRVLSPGLDKGRLVSWLLLPADARPLVEGYTLGVTAAQSALTRDDRPKRAGQ